MRKEANGKDAVNNADHVFTEPPQNSMRGEFVSARQLAQRERRERERSNAPEQVVASNRQLAQRERREREKYAGSLRQSHTSRSPLTPCRRRRESLESTQQETGLGEIASNAHKRTVFRSSMASPPISTTTPRTPTQNYNSSPSTVTPITIEDIVANHPPLPRQVDLQLPPRSLREELDSVPMREANVTNAEPLLTADNISTTERIRHRENVRHFLGNMSVKCPDCSALHWMDEKLSNSSMTHPRFGTCCLQGKVMLPLLTEPPPLILALYEGEDDQAKSFREHTRDYNTCNAFTSLGAKIDPRVLDTRGPFSFVIHGELRHRTGSLIPEHGQDGRYAQLYIYDPEPALQVRATKRSHLRQDVLKSIQDTLHEHNPFPAMYRQAHELLNNRELVGEDVPACLHYSSGMDRRRYNLPTTEEIAVIIPGEGYEISGMRDIILHLRGNNGLMQINECHPAYLPLHYVLLFPRGELGWSPDLKQWDVLHKRPSNDRLTQLQFYCYRLFQRPTEYSTILRAGKLYQEFIVDAWAATQQNRLTYCRLNQDKLRSEVYNELTDCFLGSDGLRPHQIGRRIILPASFPGSPRHTAESFQDSMAITRHNHHPDIFLTMTANPSWPEIVSALLPHQTPIDRPDLVARVFELKRKALMKEIDSKKVFGRKVAHVYTIEFQKRGLPHMHTLIFLDGPDKIRTCEQVDRLVSAEFPDPSDTNLFETVNHCMVHGPCGNRNPRSPCMENGKCTKRYPKAFAETTTMDQNGYPIYRRRDDGKSYPVGKNKVDNRDVVPYNPYLSRMFNCHINVEVCEGIRCVKYIHKYIYKGPDRATMVLGGLDEIQQYLDGLYIGPVEAAWRLFGFGMHEEFPNVVRLALHLPGMHQVTYDPSESAEQIAARAERQSSTLTAFFKYCASNEDARQYTYQEFPGKFVWVKPKSVWTPRKKGYAIGRMYFASPNSGERFYLRLLLTHVRGPTSFENLRTVDGDVKPTFKSACVALGLLEDDEEWIQCLQEASVMKTGHQLRRLFSIILTECFPLQPFELWKRFSKDICDDLSHKLRTLYGIQNPGTDQIEDYGLYLLNEMLQQAGKSLADYPPMPQSSMEWNHAVGNRLLWEHRQLQIDAQSEDVQSRIDSLNNGQRVAYDAITSAVLENRGATFFLSGGAGTGKTFTYNTVAYRIRSLGYTVITVASSGVASLLLVGGRTAHSTFSIPLDVHDDSVCGFSKQSMQAELIRNTKLIIWDEVPMQHRNCVEAVDRTLRDVCDVNKPFGGITVVLGGDFRQILPVVPKGVREQIVASSLRCSKLWNSIQILHLETNMRLNTEES